MITALVALEIVRVSEGYESDDSTLKWEEWFTRGVIIVQWFRIRSAVDIEPQLADCPALIEQPALFNAVPNFKEVFVYSSSELCAFFAGATHIP
jgi:hypothetical protein